MHSLCTPVTKSIIATNTKVSIRKVDDLGDSLSPISIRTGLKNQVSLLTVMVGNLLEKSLALAAILIATCRATDL